MEHCLQVRFKIYVTRAQHAELKRRSEREGRPAAELIRDAIDVYLTRPHASKTSQSRTARTSSAFPWMPDVLVDGDVFIDRLPVSGSTALEAGWLVYSIVTRAELFSGHDIANVPALLRLYGEVPLDSWIAETAGLHSGYATCVLSDGARNCGSTPTASD